MSNSSDTKQPTVYRQPVMKAISCGYIIKEGDLLELGQLDGIKRSLVSKSMAIDLNKNPSYLDHHQEVLITSNLHIPDDFKINENETKPTTTRELEDLVFKLQVENQSLQNDLESVTKKLQRKVQDIAELEIMARYPKAIKCGKARISLGDVIINHPNVPPIHVTEENLINCNRNMENFFIIANTLNNSLWGYGH